MSDTVWTSQLWWFSARAGGIVAWMLLSASVVWGLLLSTKLLGRRPRPAWLLDLHRFLGGLSVVFTALHVGALIADSYVAFGPAEVLVPFASSWRPSAVAWGVIGLYLLLAVEVTSLLRRRLPRALWRATHLLAFPLFGFSTAHALTAGTDVSATAWRLVMAMFASAVIGLVAARQARRYGAPAPSGRARIAGGRLQPAPVGVGSARRTEDREAPPEVTARR